MESKQCYSEKKNRKRGTTEPDHQSRPRGLVRCSYSEDEEKKKEEEEITEAPEPEPEPPLLSRGLVRCSSFSSEKEEEKSKYEEFDYSLKPLITTVTKTTIDTTSITIITPPEDPIYHIHLYLCIRTDIKTFSWFKIDPTDTTLEAPSSSNNYNDNDNSKGKLKKKKPILLRRPISHMPPTTPYGFCAIPHSSSSSSCLAKGKRKKKKKLVYAVGGSIDVRGCSSKAFVCDFASTKPVWKELPQMPSPMHICMGVASPLDGHVYAFGPMLPEAPAIPFKYAGLVFDPSLPSWKPCPPPFSKNHPNSYPINDYALAKTENRTELCVFTCSTRAHSFNLATAQWDRSLYAPVPADSLDVDSSSVGVGHLILKFHDRKLYALDTTSPKPSFKPVPGLDNKLPKCWEAHGGGDMVYLGKGKLCIIWSSIPKKPPRGTVSIACLMFWVGMCNRRNRLCAVIDRCERFVAHGLQLCDVVAL